MRKLGRHPVDRVFDKAFQNAEMPVSKNVWAGIASELEKDDLRKKVFWYRSLAVASLALLMGLGAWMLAWQAGNNNASALSMGKALKPWHLTSRELPCETSNERLAQANAAALNATPKAAANTDAFTTAPRQRSRHTSTQLVWANAQVPSNAKTSREGAQPQLNPASENALKEGISKAAQNFDAVRRSVRSRKPDLLPTVADLGRRQFQGLQVPQDPGLLSSLASPKSNDRRREKEFAFALEDETPVAKPQKHWELGAGFAPDITFASTTPVEQQVSKSARIIANDPTEANTNRLSPVMAYASTLRASYEFNDRLSLRSGMTYTNRQSSTTEAVSAYGKVDSYQSTLNLTTMEVPLSVRYNVVKNKNFDYYVTSGVSGTFLLHYANTQVTSTGRVAARRGSDLSDVMRPSQGNLLLSTGMRYRIFDRLNLQVEPGLRYGLLTNEYAFSQSRPVSMSLLTGLNYHF
jgi:outer membrane protein W